MDVTRASAMATLAPYYLKKGVAELEAKVGALMARIEKGPVRPDPTMSQPIETVAGAGLYLGTHPDIIERMWTLDKTLPHSCRWALWGKPALVHPETGIVFAVGYGSIGMVMRLPPSVLDGADPKQAIAKVVSNPAKALDFSEIGPEWRIVSWAAQGEEWARAAYEFAGIVAQ